MCVKTDGPREEEGRADLHYETPREEERGLRSVSGPRRAR